MRVELHIEELVLEGFDSRDRHRIRDAVERELTRLLGEERELRQVRQEAHVPELRAQFSMRAGSTPGRVGAQLAEAVHQAVSRRSKT
jgi:hypothetical protein